MQSKYGNTNINSEWLRSSLLGQPNGIAELGPDGLVPSSQLGGLDNLLDVTLTSPVSDGDVLVYNSLTGLWTNQAFLSGGEGLAQTLAIGQASGGNDILMTESDDIVFQYSTFGNFINTNPLTADRNILFPDASGTVALLSDIQAADQLSEVLALGNNTGGTDILVNTAEKIQFEAATDYIQRSVQKMEYFSNRGHAFSSAAGGYYEFDNGGTLSLNDVVGGNFIYHIAASHELVSDDGTNQGRLQFGASITNDPVWTMPNATGTVALLSDIPAGAGDNIYNVDGTLTGNRLVTTSTNTIRFINGSDDIVLDPTNNRIGFKNAGIGDKTGWITTNGTLTADQTYTLQNASGTLAFLSDIPSLSGSGTTNYIPKWTPDGNTLGDSLIQEGIFNTIGMNSPAFATTLLNIASDKNTGLSLDQTQASSTAQSTGIYGSARGINTSVFGNTGTRGSAVLATQYNVGVHGHGGSGIFTVLPFNLGSVGVVGQATSSIVGKDIATFAGYSTSSHADDTYGIYLDVSNPGAGDAYIGVLKDGSQGDGKALVSDSVGRASWQNITYDSGWKAMNFHNGTFGWANTGNAAYVPRIRVIDRTVHIRGSLNLPMPTVAGGTTLDTSGIGYVANFYPDLYTGINGGWSISAIGRDEARTLDSVLPTNLTPVNTISAESLHNVPIIRTVNYNGRIKISHFCTNFVLLSDGRVQINTIRTVERNGNTGTSWTQSMQARYIIDKFQNGDSIYEFDNYYNSYDGAFATDKRVVQDTGANYGFDFDGSLPEHLGGMVLSVHMTYPVDSNLTLDQVKTAFDSI